jgi:hypothetical protein
VNLDLLRARQIDLPPHPAHQGQGFVEQIAKLRFGKAPLSPNSQNLTVRGITRTGVKKGARSHPTTKLSLTHSARDKSLALFIFIEKDVISLPLQIDRDFPAVGKYRACRRIARTVFLGSAPLPKAANNGMEDRRIKLGCSMPGVAPAVFGDALRRLADKATYLYSDGPHYWYATQPTVIKLAEDLAEQFNHKR